jgi:NADPH:quinone reductase-like Zn-dependent oxidoreductase
MRAIQISAFGKLTEVLKLVDIPEPAAPASGEALIGVEFAPINHNDLLLIREHFTTPRHFRWSSATKALGAFWLLVPTSRM